MWFFFEVWPILSSPGNEATQNYLMFMISMKMFSSKIERGQNLSQIKLSLSHNLLRWQYKLSLTCYIWFTFKNFRTDSSDSSRNKERRGRRKIVKPVALKAFLNRRDLLLS
jgi:hypothetical protein